MSYDINEWIARQGTKLNRFQKQNETATHIELVNDPTEVTKAGTPFSVEKMNNIEKAIYGNDTGFSYGEAAQSFTNIYTANKEWTDIILLDSGDLLACESFGDIYIRSESTGTWSALGLSSQWWTGMTETGGGVVACSQNSAGGDPGNIFDIDVGAGTATSRGSGTEGNWYGIAYSAAIGRIYAVQLNDDVYWLDSSSTVAAQGHGSKAWYDITAADDGFFYLVASSDRIYRLITFTPSPDTALEPLPDSSRQYRAISHDLSNGITYASDVDNIYRRRPGESVFTLFTAPGTETIRAMEASSSVLYAGELPGDVYIAPASIGQAYTNFIEGAEATIQSGMPAGTRRYIFPLYTGGDTDIIATDGETISTNDTGSVNSIQINVPIELLKVSATEWFLIRSDASRYNIGNAPTQISDNTGLIRSRTVSTDTTVAQTDHLGVINVTAETATVTWPSGLAIGTRVQVRKIGTDEAQSVDTVGAGGVVFTASQETEIPLYGNGGNWIFEQVTSTRVELVGGWDAGSNSNGEWSRDSSGKQICYTPYNSILDNNSDESTGSIYRSETNSVWSYPIDFTNVPITVFEVASDGRWVSLASNGATTTSAEVKQFSAAALSSTASINGIATGRWLPLS